MAYPYRRDDQQPYQHHDQFDSEMQPTHYQTLGAPPGAMPPYSSQQIPSGPIIRRHQLYDEQESRDPFVGGGAAPEYDMGYDQSNIPIGGGNPNYLDQNQGQYQGQYYDHNDQTEQQRPTYPPLPTMPNSNSYSGHNQFNNSQLLPTDPFAEDFVTPLLNDGRGGSQNHFGPSPSSSGNFGGNNNFGGNPDEGEEENVVRYGRIPARVPRRYKTVKSMLLSSKGEILD